MAPTQSPSAARAPRSTRKAGALVGTVAALAAAGGLIVMADGSAAERPRPAAEVSVPTRFVFEDPGPSYPEPSHQPIPRFIDPADIGQPIQRIESMVIRHTNSPSITRASTLAMGVVEHPGGPGVYKPRVLPSMTKRALAPPAPIVEKTIVAAPAPAPAPAPVAAPVIETPAAPVEAPAVEAAPAPAPAPTGPVLTPSGRVEPTADQWASLRHCEATGNYQAVNPSGKYRGAYQFDQRTWMSVGGSGDPAAASPAEQDLRAYILYDSRGASPWPQCGRFLPQ